MNTGAGEPLVSIIIPAYNQSKTLRECINAIKKSNYSNYEIIVMNCGSTDDTEGILKELPVKAISSGEKTPPGKTRNNGARYSSGEILILIDADVLIGKNAIRHCVDLTISNPEIAGVTLIYSSEHPNKNLFSQYQNLFMNYRFAHIDKYTIMPTTSFLAIRKSIFFEVGGFNEKMETYEDFEFGYRTFLKKNMKFIIDFSEQVVHCKYFNFITLMMDYFTKVRNMVRFRLECYETLKSLPPSNNTSVPVSLIFAWLLSPALIISGIIAAFGITPFLPFMLFTTLYLIALFPFCNYLRKHNGCIFFIKSIILTIAIGIVVDYAAICAVVKFFVIKKKNEQ